MGIRSKHEVVEYVLSIPVASINEDRKKFGLER
jgi:hypothetical protein